MKYRKKPVVIEAIKFTGKNVDELTDFVGDNLHYSGTYFYIPTLEGAMIVSEGDYVIKGVKGEFYPCKPDIFEETYEPVEEPDRVIQAPLMCDINVYEVEETDAD